jgi:hypothetical protein
MKTAMQRVCLAFSLCALLLGSALAQEQRASPHATVELMLGGKKVTISYGRPSMKGRKIVGGLVPYGEVWRTGADEATKLTTEADLMIGTLLVPKGSYALFTLPTAQGWKLIVNKKSDQWGAFNYSAQDDLGRVDMKVGKTAKPVEQFTMSLTKAGAGGLLKLEWENTSASVAIKAK